MFNATRLILARKRRGMKQRELAKQIGVSDRSVIGYENGSQIPEIVTLGKICDVLKFPDEFFFREDPEFLTPDEASFRSLTKMTAGQRDSALGAGSIALMLNDWIESKFDLPTVDVPDLGRERSTLLRGCELRESDEEVEYPDRGRSQDAEAAADMLRAQWGLGEQPIPNLIKLLESKGVRIYSLAIDANEVDAFSMWKGGTPFIFLNTTKSAEHCRFDAAHELGHLVLHKQGHPQGPDLEREANAFASSFLMPRSDVLARAPRAPTIPNLILHKKYWGVSVAALNFRLRALGLTTEWTNRTLCIQIAQEGFRKFEPEPMQHERSFVLEKVFASLREEGLTKADVAAQLSITSQEINELTFGLMLNVLKGGARQNKPPTRHSKATLRLVT